MSEARVETPPAHAVPAAPPWSVRLVESAPLPPLAAGAALALLLYLLFLFAELLWGDLALVARGEAPRWKLDEYVFTAALALFAGYVPAAHALALDGARRTFDALRPALRGTPTELAALRDGVTRFRAGALRRAGAWGVAFSLLVPLAVDLSFDAYWIGSLNLAAVSHRVLLPAIGWTTGRFAYSVTLSSRRLADLALRARIDLLDLSPLAPLVRQGLRNALLAVGMVSITLLLAPVWGARPGLAWVLSVGLLLSLAAGAAGLLLPVRGARAAIGAAKRTELAWCSDAIRRRREALGLGGNASGAPHLDELVSYRALVASVREWPFDASTLTRFALYLGIPVGSWLGGALVERLVDALLG